MNVRVFGTRVKLWILTTFLVISTVFVVITGCSRGLQATHLTKFQLDDHRIQNAQIQLSLTLIFCL